MTVWPLVLLLITLALYLLWAALAWAEDAAMRRARERAVEMRRHPSAGGRLGGDDPSTEETIR